MLRKTIYATLIVVLTTGTASAQMDNPGVPGYSYSRTDVEKKNDQEIDRTYQSTIKRDSGAEKKKSDPWAVVRPDPSAAAKNKRQ